MLSFNYRHATLKDVPFLVDTIIEAEKSGTNILTYSTIFGLTEYEARLYITKMFQEEIDGCELSVSSYMIAEYQGQFAASVGAWIEGYDGIPSNIIKGNLLNYILPRKCIEKAALLTSILNETHIECFQNSIQIGVVYVANEYRGMKLAGNLIDRQILRLTEINPKISDIFVQVFGNNTPAIKAYENSQFSVILINEGSNKKVQQYLPSDRKVLMKRNLKT